MPTKFTRTRDGETKTRMAHSPAEEVQLRYEGWTPANPAPTTDDGPVYADGSTAADHTEAADSEPEQDQPARATKATTNKK